MSGLLYRIGIGVKNKLLEWHNNLLEWRPDNQPWVVALRMFRFAGVKEALKRERMHYCKRLGWILVFSICLSYGITMCVKTWKQFIQRPILHAFHDAGGVPLDKIPFPGITVASPYLFRQSTMEEAFQMYRQIMETKNVINKDGQDWSEKDILKLIHMIDHICGESGNSFAKKFHMTNENKYVDLHEYTSWVAEQNISLHDYFKDRVSRKKVIPYVKKGLINCTSVLSSCVWRGSKDQTCPELFKAVQTDVGTGCGFNKIPEDALRMDRGLKSILHDHGTSLQELQLWENWSIDDHPFLGGDKLGISKNDFPRRQVAVGFDNGISFIIKYKNNNTDTACPVIDSKNYRVCIHHPFEEPRLKLDGCLHIPPTKQVFIKVRVELTVSDSNIKSLTPDTRKCYFEKEKPLSVFKRYTQSNCYKECWANTTIKICQCHPLSVTAGKGELICGPLNRKCVENVTETFKAEGYNSLCQDCYRPCTEIVYKAEATYSDVEIDNTEILGLGETDTFSLVHVFFNEESVINRERSRRFDSNELVGVLGGIIGLTNGVDILQIFNVLAGLSMFWSITYKIAKRVLCRCREAESNQQNTQSPVIANTENSISQDAGTTDHNRSSSFEQTSRSDMTIVDIEEYGETTNSNPEPGCSIWDSPSSYDVNEGGLLTQPAASGIRQEVRYDQSLLKRLHSTSYHY